MQEIVKSFGTTRAVRGVDFTVNRAEVVGLIGGNGAGKSTLMKIVGGLIPADKGAMRLSGLALGADHSPSAAMKLGVRFVHQELSLCPNLRVYENFAVDLADVIRGVRWRSRAVRYAIAALAEVFPDSRIDPRAKVGSLSLSQQQMVEIARSACHPKTRLVILDEPTSSLGAREAEHLQTYVRRRVSDGLSFIFISHRLHETRSIADQIVVMRNGLVAWSGKADSVSQSELLQLLGGAKRVPGEREVGASHRTPDPVVTLTRAQTLALHGISLEVGHGEIVGLAGLEGSGQREVLRSVFAARNARSGAIRVNGEVAFVSGDRLAEGIFPLWSINENIAISGLKRLSRWGFVSIERMREATLSWFRRLQVHATDGSDPITSLSGGNQQKVVIARALAADADVILLDDPTRGVDLGTKADLYKLFRAFADQGGGVLWYSTDETEFVECDRTLVMSDGAVVAEFGRQKISAERLVEASFRTADVAVDEPMRRRSDRARRLESKVPALIPLVTFTVVFALCVSQSRSILSSFGLTLVFSAAFPLAFAATSQLFMIAAGDIDLGLGPFIGLVNAIAATWLVTDPLLAVECFAALLVAYPLMGLFIHARRVPAIIVTLGMSFIWLGFASLRLPRAGGAAPDWLVAMIKIKPPLLPMSVYLSLFPVVAAYLVLKVWRYGAVLRGFGANPPAIAAAGWSTHLAKATLYSFAGLFAFLAGIVVTANTRGGDPTGATSMTLLAVAAVILGGAAFGGGVVAPIGALFGVLTLGLVGTLLSLFEVNGVYLPMVQGLLLLGVVGVRTLLVRRSA
jgi:ribose transport system ATP-binding protein